MAKRIAAKPAPKSTAASTAAKKKAPAVRRGPAVKTAPVAKKPVAVKAPVAARKEAATPVVKAVQKTAEPRKATVSLPSNQLLKVAVNGREQAQNYTVIGKAAIDAYVESGNLFAQNFGTFNREVMAFAQAALENSIETARALAGASSLSEAVDLQTKHSQKSFDGFLAESAKLTELSVEFANETIAPLQSNIKETVEKLIKPIAA
jgi:phasin family protein